ncbi:MAG: pentapeptide repeat-containing protein [Pseudomonadota bacterium]
MDGAALFLGSIYFWLALLAAIVVVWTIAAWRGAAIIKWLEKKAGEHAEKRMPPSNEPVFKRRIARRVRWLRIKDWWKHKNWRKSLADNLIRPLIVIAMFAASLALIEAFGIPLEDLGDRIRDAVSDTEDSQKAVQLRGQTVLIVLGIPLAFVLWWFRDMHVRNTLDNQRKDVNLKEFQEIQMRAAGAMDEKLPEDARRSLQVAATHQLAGFLKGEYGESFRRPAWELLRARLQESSQRVGYPAIRAWLNEWREADPSGQMPASELSAEIYKAKSAIEMDSTGKAQREVVRDEWRAIFGRHLPLPNTVFDGINLPEKTLIASRDLSRCSFIGANLWGTHLEGANLQYAHLEGAFLTLAHLEGAYLWEGHLEGANLTLAHLEGANLGSAHLEGANLGSAHLEGTNLGDAHLEGAYLWEAHLEGANLGGAHLEGADLRDAHLEGADLWHAHLEGANLRGAHLEGADLWDAHLDEETQLTGAVFDDKTAFANDWPYLSDEEKAKARARWIERGIVHADTLKDDGEDA